MASTLKLDNLAGMASSDAVAKVTASLPKWVALALIVVIGWQIASILFALLDTPGGAEDPGAIEPVAAAADNGGGPAFDVGAIQQAKLFGDLVARPENAPPPQEDVDEETDLNLELKGTIAADDPDYARAIIADAQRKEKVYAVKDPVSQGVTLHAVETTRVILNENGRLTSLDLPQEFKGSARTTRRVNRPTRVSSARASTQSASVRDALTTNSANLTDIIRPQPYFQGGQQRGYRVYPGKDRQKFAALGLRPGDLVTEINGTAMSDPRQGLAVFRSLGDATSVNVTIERNGQPQQLTLSTDQLDNSQ